MAYDAFGEYIGGQRDPYMEERKRQEEEERQRREEAERLARAAAVAGGPGVAGGAGSGTYFDEQGRLIVMEPVTMDTYRDPNPNAVITPGTGPYPVANVDITGQGQGADPLGAFIDQQLQGFNQRERQAPQAAPVTPVAPDEVVKKEQVETRADGSRVVKTTQEVPSGAVATPVRPQPEIVAAPLPAMAAPPAPAVAPVAPPAAAPTAAVSALPQDYNARIAQMESGNNPNIGYHDRARSSAYGKYGITDAAWTDIQRANPALAGVRKEQATPEQMEMAQNTHTQNLQRRLTGLGIEANPNTLSAAHFLGAQGLANYLRDGSISPAAVKANGGYEKTKAIVDGRLGGFAAPASGAAAARPVAPGIQTRPAINQETGEVYQEIVPENERIPLDQPFRVTVPLAGQAPAAPVAPGTAPEGFTGQGLQLPPQRPQPAATPSTQAIQRYQDSQNDPMALLKLRNDETVPAFIRERAGNQAYELLNRERKTATAETQVERLVASGDQAAIAKTMASKPKTEEGSFLKAALYARLGLTDLAAEEQRKLGAGDKWTSVTGPNGENALVKVAANGRPLEGIKSDGTAFSDNELVQYGGGGALGKGASLSSEVYVDQATGQRYRSGFDNSGKAALVNIQGGAPYRGDPKNLTIQSIGTAAAKAENAAAVKLKYAGPTSYTEAGAAAAGKFNFENGTNIGYQSQQPGAPLVDLNTGKPVQVGAGGVISVTQSGTPGTAPAGAAPAGAAPAGAPSAPAVAAPGGATPAQIIQQQAVSKVAQEQFVKTTVPAVNEEGNNARQVASIRRQQLSTIASNPSILNIFNGTGTNYDRARNVITKLVTGAYGEENSGDFYKEVKALGLTEGERGALEDFANANMAINSKTLKANSGAGAVSNAEQKANQNANLQNLAETTALGAMGALHRSQFTGDLGAARQHFLNNNPGLNDDAKFNNAWSKESAKYTKAYEGIIEARAEFLKPFRPPANATKEQLAVFKDKVFKAFEMYPAPQFDSESGKWNYQTANAQRAAAKKLLGR